MESIFVVKTAPSGFVLLSSTTLARSGKRDSMSARARKPSSTACLLRLVPGTVRARPSILRVVTSCASRLRARRDFVHGMGLGYTLVYALLHRRINGAL